MGVINSCHKFSSLTLRYYIAIGSSSREPHTASRMRMTAVGRCLLLLLLKAAAISHCRVSSLSLSLSLLCCGRCLLMTWQEAILAKLLRQLQGNTLERKVRKVVLIVHFEMYQRHIGPDLVSFFMSSFELIVWFLTLLCRVFSMAGMSQRRRIKPKEGTIAC